MKFKEYIAEAKLQDLIGFSLDFSGNTRTITEKTPNEIWEGEFTIYEASPAIESLYGAPKEVRGTFYVVQNPWLKSLQYCPQIITSNCWVNKNKLQNLEYAPSFIGGVFVCSNNVITSLKNIHTIITHIGEIFDIRSNPLKSNVLGLLKIEGLTTVKMDNKKLETILNEYLKGTRDILDCQEELIEADLSDFAQL